MKTVKNFMKEVQQLDEIGKFLERYKLSKFNTKQIGNLKSLVSIKDIEFRTFKLPQRETLGTDSFTRKFFKTFK